MLYAAEIKKNAINEDSEENFGDNFKTVFLFYEFKPGTEQNTIFELNIKQYN